MNECCGQPRSGQFCSECGSPLKGGPLYDLLKSCRKSELLTKRAAEKARERAEKNPDDSYAVREGTNNEKRTIAWKARGDALAALLAKLDEQDGTH